jgi:hypothetical protein
MKSLQEEVEEAERRHAAVDEQVRSKLSKVEGWRCFNKHYSIQNNFFILLVRYIFVVDFFSVLFFSLSLSMKPSIITLWVCFYAIDQHVISMNHYYMLHFHFYTSKTQVI